MSLKRTYVCSYYSPSALLSATPLREVRDQPVTYVKDRTLQDTSTITTLSELGVALLAEDVASAALLMATQPGRSRIAEIRMRPMVESLFGRDPV